MNENELILQKEFESLKTDIIALYDAKGMRASGDFANSLKVEVTSDQSGSTAILHGNSYAEQLDSGREPTKNGNTGGPTVYEQILEWIVDKGIQPIENDISISSLAFLITRKIHRDGWKREKHGGVDLISGVITPQRVQQIIEKVTVVNITDITSKITSLYKEFEKA